jgi:hypothetical protein
MPFAEANLHALQSRIDAPLLGVIEHAPAFDARAAAGMLDAGTL